MISKINNTCFYATLMLVVSIALGSIAPLEAKNGAAALTQVLTRSLLQALSKEIIVQRQNSIESLALKLKKWAADLAAYRIKSEPAALQQAILSIVSAQASEQEQNQARMTLVLLASGKAVVGSVRHRIEELRAMQHKITTTIAMNVENYVLPIADAAAQL